jgi:subtilisin family serine protease
LTVAKSRINIITDNKSAVSTSVISQNIGIAFNDSAVSPTIRKISFATIPSENQYNTIVNTLRQNQNVKKVVPYFLRGNAEPIGTSDIFYVKLKNLNGLSVLQSVAQQKSVQIIKQVPYMPLWYILSVKNSVFNNSVEASNFFYETGSFDNVDPAFMFNFKSNCVNDPTFNQQWGLFNSSNINIDINACDAWTVTRGAGINVAVVDQGIDRNHNDLSANLHTISFDAQSGTSPSVFNGLVHGTHVAGIIGAVRNNNLQVVGVAPEAQIIGVSHDLYMSSTYSAEMASGISWAMQNGADIITNSWGDQGGFLYNDMHSVILESAILDAINNGREGKGCIVTFSAGNKSPVMDYCNRAIQIV